MDSETAEAYVDAAAAALGLPIHPDHRPGVLTYFRLAASMADLVTAPGLHVEDDAAPVFVPIEPGHVVGADSKKRVR
jgi:hypothetical protein